MELIKELNQIQKKLKCNKSQFNSFGNYAYRSTEDILEAIKPLLPNDLTLFITDKIIKKENRYYVEATVILTDGKEKIKVKALAREAEMQKGMNEAQLTGSSSSYARKYALNGLFLIDDTKDADTQNNTQVGKSNQIVKDRQAGKDKCEKCKKDISLAEASFSKGKLGTYLCRDCQKTY